MRRHNDNRMPDSEQSWLDGEVGTRAHVLLVDGKEVAPREYARVMSAQGPQSTEEEIQAAQAQNVSRPFRFMR